MDNIQRVQEILNRGLYDKLDGDKKARVDEAINRGLVTMPGSGEPIGEPTFQQQQQPGLTQQYPEGASSTMNVDGGEDVRNQNFVHPDTRTMVNVAGGMGGGFVSGGNPLGAAGGYALSDLLYQKFHEGEEITPENAAKRFGEGLLMEAVPKAALIGGQKVLGKIAHPKWLYGHSLKVPADIVQKEADRLSAIGLKHELPVSAKGIEKAQKIASKSKGEVDSLINTADETGVTIDIDSAVERARASLTKEWEDVVGSSPDINKINKEVDSILESYGDITPTYKKVNGYPQSERNISVKLAQKIKSDTQAVSNKEYSNAVRFGHKSDNPTRSRLRAMIASELRDDIEKAVPGVIPFNETSHDVLSWMGHASQRVRHSATQPLVSSRLLAPAVIETMYKGAPATATALAGASLFGASSNPMSHIAIAAQKQEAKNIILDSLINKTKLSGKYIAGGMNYTNGEPVVSGEDYSGLTDNFLQVLNYKGGR